MTYEEESGLLLGKRTQNGEFVTYQYDEYGRAVGTGLTSGEHFGLEETPCGSGFRGVCKNLSKNGMVYETLQVSSDGQVTFGTHSSCPLVVDGPTATTSLCSKLELSSQQVHVIVITIATLLVT